jgi:hypothetical protein
VACPIILEHFCLFFPCEQRPSIQKLVIDCSQTEHIALHAQPDITEVFNLQDFRRDVAGSAASDEDVGRFIDAGGQPEIYYLDCF